MADRTTEHIGPPELGISRDFKFINADLFGVAVTTKKDGSKHFALSVFETILLPEYQDGGLVGIKPVRQAASTLALSVETARALNDALSRAFLDIDSAKKNAEG